MNGSRSDPPGHVDNSQTKSAVAASNSERSTTAYRDDLSAAVLRREELLRLHQGDIERAPAIAALVARRKARLAAGIVGVLGFVVVAVGALSSLAEGFGHEQAVLTRILLGSWVVALVVWGAVGVLVGRAVRARLETWSAKSDRPAVDVARLETAHPIAALKREADGLEVGSIAAPMMGAAMLLPLTLHFLFGLESLDRFDRWIVISVVFVGHAHLLFAGLCWRYARKLRTGWPNVGATLEAYKALLVTAASCVFPTVLFAPGLVLLTGVIPAPVLFVVARRVLARERAVLDFGEWAELRLGRPGEGTGPAPSLPPSALRFA